MQNLGYTHAMTAWFLQFQRCKLHILHKQTLNNYMYTAMKYLHKSLSGFLKYFNLICQNIKIILTDNYKEPLMYMASVNKQPICGMQHCVLKVIMAGIVCFANWKYLVQTKLQNPFRKLGSCVHEYS
jgi:hypothetical protein